MSSGNQIARREHDLRIQIKCALKKYKTAINHVRNRI